MGPTRHPPGQAERAATLGMELLGDRRIILPRLGKSRSEWLRRWDHRQLRASWARGVTRHKLSPQARRIIIVERSQPPFEIGARRRHRVQKLLSVAEA